MCSSYAKYTHDASGAIVLPVPVVLFVMVRVDSVVIGCSHLQSV